LEALQERHPVTNFSHLEHLDELELKAYPIEQERQTEPFLQTLHPQMKLWQYSQPLVDSNCPATQPVPQTLL
jgi:hypothetical protein